MVSVRALTHLEFIELGKGHKLDLGRMGISTGRQLIENQRLNQIIKM